MRLKSNQICYGKIREYHLNPFDLLTYRNVMDFKEYTDCKPVLCITLVIELFKVE